MPNPTTRRVGDVTIVVSGPDGAGAAGALAARLRAGGDRVACVVLGPGEGDEVVQRHDIRRVVRQEAVELLRGGPCRHRHHAP